MTDYFKGIETVEDGKKLYRRLLKENHPDVGGSEDACKEIVRQFEVLLKNLLQNAFNKVGDDKTYGANINVFADVLSKIKDFNMVIEIVGYWIYARAGSYDYKEQLKEMGFFFSGKHKAWIYNGGRKAVKFRTNLTMDQIRTLHGSTMIRGREEKLAIEA